MRLTHTVSLTVALGPSLTPALTFGEEEPLVENQPNPDSEIAPHVTEAKIDAASRAPEIIKLLREKVKHVFVIFQENRAFDQMFGTFPGAHGLFSQSESETPYDPNNTQLSRGPRVPLLVISPYAQTHIVSHEVG
jgi:phospholipase C